MNCDVPSSSGEFEHIRPVILVRQIETPGATEEFHGGEVIEFRQRVSTRRVESRRSRIAFRTMTRVSNQFWGLSVLETVGMRV